ncbi:MAG: HD domain-containing protein [Planctomycetaceae bacterium]|nr:HD domain-containing protein [Planctomycetaceae bacterium]MCB9953921.1 HD domain-containing protein [Planctomycetaceae bacterium]
MTNEKLRRQICFEAARLMYSRQESEYYRAKMKAARKILRGWVPASYLPSNAEIRDEIQRFAWMYEGEQRFDDLRGMRLLAYRTMTLLQRFRPRLIGSTLTGYVRAGSDVDLHLFTSSIAAVTNTLDDEGLIYDVEHKEVRKQGECRIYTHVHVKERYPIELTIYSLEEQRTVFQSSITGKPIEYATLNQLREFLEQEYPGVDLDADTEASMERIDRFAMYRLLLAPLEKVDQGRTHHPEGDALYHSLQVFELARNALPWDEEFLLAALLHDVGKAIDPYDHVVAGLQAMDGFISDRTTWLIEHHMEAHKLRDGSIGARSRRRLASHEDFETLVLLEECDYEGRVPGAYAPELDEALDYIREIASDY